MIQINRFFKKEVKKSILDEVEKNEVRQPRIAKTVISEECFRGGLMTVVRFLTWVLGVAFAFRILL
jgi:hypothetical protein